jgi:hypothetical protein
LSVSLGYDHGCVVTSLGFIQCFGWNHKGQLGTGVTSIGVSAIATVSLISFPDWLYYINSWTISYESDLAILKWVGGQPRYKVRIDGLGIVCEDLATAFCKFGPLKSNTTYKGEITALNAGGTSPLIGVSPFEFTTGTLVAAIDQYAINQQAIAKAAQEKELAAAKLEKEKADLAKANVFLAGLTKQIDLALKVESQAVTNFTRDLVDADKYIQLLSDNDSKVVTTQIEIKKILAILQNLVLKIVKKIGS